MSDSPKPVRIGGVRIGGIEVDRELALESARTYLSRRDRFGYPAYDSFGEGGPWQISDADLVAPVLLNAEMNSRTYYALEAIRGHLENWLVTVPLDARLVEAGPAELAQLGELFSVLDSEDLPVDARGSILAKVMHRKRPAFIPLYDRFVDYCYRGVDTAPIPKNRKRGWRQFLPLLGRAIIDDLVEGKEFFDQVAALAAGPGDHPAAGVGHRRLARRSQQDRTGHLGGVDAAGAGRGAPGEPAAVEPDDEQP